MDDKQRLHIIKNLDKLIRLTNYEELITHCVNNGLLSYVMRQHIENIKDLRDDELQQERHKRLFVKLTKRGPTAYRHLKSLLSELKCDAAVLLLNEPMHNESQFMPLNPGMYQSRDLVHKPQLIETIPNYTPLITPSHTSSRLLADYNKQQHIDDTVDECQKNYSSVDRDKDGLPILQQYNKEIESLSMYEVKKSTKLHTDDKVGCYRMHSKQNRGVFFCVNIIDFPNKERRRNGAEEDRKSLLYLFKELGFKLFYYENLRQSEFEHLLDLILQSKYTRETESFVMALMTHGESTDQYTEIVEFADGAVMKVREIEKRFDNGVCGHLLHKPKILIFPFCRGKIKDFGQRQLQQQKTITPQQLYRIQTDHISIDELPQPVPTFSDMIISFASLRGYAAHRHPLEGSWYIQTFCQLMAENAHDTSFNNILMMIQTKMLEHSDNGAIQMPTYHNIGFSKMLYLNPGVWVDD